VELSGYFAVVRRWWWTLLVAAWVAGLAGFYVASRIQPSYESSVKLLVAPLNTDADTLRSAGLLVQTYAQVVTTSPILGRAVTQTVTPTSMSADELGASTRVVANDVTRVLTITVRTGDPAVHAVPRPDVYPGTLEGAVACVHREPDIPIRPHDYASIILTDTAEHIRVSDVDASCERDPAGIRIRRFLRQKRRCHQRDHREGHQHRQTVTRCAIQGHCCTPQMSRRTASWSGVIGQPTERGIRVFARPRRRTLRPCRRPR